MSGAHHDDQRETARPRYKRLVVCTDGTWNDAVSGGITNVLRLARSVERYDHDGVPQIVYYHTGLGTGPDFLDRWIGGATGYGISRNLRDAYAFIVQNYAPGDEIFLFGFSRGAYTARSLAGLIRNAGILRADHSQLFAEAYELYRRRDPSSRPSAPEATAFRRHNSHGDTRITLIGVWDTVGALGVPLGFARYGLRLWEGVSGQAFLHEFHDVELSSFVDHAYHAVAIGERREAFRPTLWKVTTPRAAHQTCEQAWLPGVHCNIGGGYPMTGLSDLALQWMADRVQRHGLAIDLAVLDPKMDPDESEQPQDAQTLGYRTIALAKKLNALTIGVGLSDEEVEDLTRRVDWYGNYHRPVPDARRARGSTPAKTRRVA